VIDKEALADLRAGMDVDPGPGVGDLGDDPREKRRVEIELVRQTVAHDRRDPGKQKITSSMLFAEGSLAKAARTSLSSCARTRGRAAANLAVTSRAGRRLKFGVFPLCS
jgi:hypothetical protein